MHLLSALFASASIITATSAFLITPEIADAGFKSEESWNLLLFPRPVSLDVECDNCPFFVDAPPPTPETLLNLATPNKIHLEFSTSGSELQVNNATIFPYEAIANTFPHVTARQIRNDNGEVGLESSVDFVIRLLTPPPSNPRFHHNKFGRMNPEMNVQLIPIEMTIIGLEGAAVNAQAAQVDLIRNEDGSLTIARLQAIDIEPSTNSGCENASNPRMCRVKSMVASQFAQMIEEARTRAADMKAWMKTHPAPDHKSPKKPCGGRGKFGKFPKDHPHGDGEGKFPKDHPHGDGEGKFPKDHPHGDREGKGPFRGPHRGPHGEDGAHDRPSHGHHHEHHGHHRGHHMGHVMHRIMSTFVVPALLGIAGGLAASALGMMVGQSIAYLWFKFGRGGRRGEIENVRVYEVAIQEGEKDNLMAEEGLPQYEEKS